MRQPTLTRMPSLASDIFSLARLYRTVFWMIGRKAQYGRIWPREADMGPGESPAIAPAPSMASFEAPPAMPVEAGARD